MRISAILRTGFILSVLFLSLCVPSLQAQKVKNSNALVYVGKDGVLRWTKNNAEAAFFGVNYTAPFAYSYRAHKALGVDIETAIRQDVYHLARLGLDAFRVHVWDTEISDSLGNLLENDHLRLFDFLLSELEKRNIRVIITPIAFWGNGYPERDERTPGFSRVFGKGQATSNDTAIRAQENYLRQFFKHVNPYTRLSYTDDPDVIAVELNNEPSHSGPKAGVTNYINRLAAAVKSDGWVKPLFYNISQSPYYADAVAASEVNGFSFQWYPSGLVAGYEQKGNFLPNVDRYRIPYDTIPGFRNKARMVYEFESADVLQSYMYPVMARSFREAGFQWATQFAYDPLALAYANTEYQTHYLNLAYTPSKAISILIASRVFHGAPRMAHYGVYPADSVFDAGATGQFRVSYRNELSEMNSREEFYYTNTTDTRPVDIAALRHLAGVGTSPVVRYGGTGAYFLDRVGEGSWRLEVMPDAIALRDPFEKAAPDKEVTRVEWNREPMDILLPDLGEGFAIRGLNAGNDRRDVAAGTHFSISPGTWLVSRAGVKGGGPGAGTIGVLGMNEFVAPQPFSAMPFVVNASPAEVSAGKPFTIRAKIAGIDSTDVVTLQVNRLGGGFPGRGGFGGARLMVMTRETPYDYSAGLSAELLEPGVLEYRIMIRKAGRDKKTGGDTGAEGEWFAFPGDHRGDPFGWDYINNDHWRTYVAAENAGLEIYDPATDREINVYSSSRRGFPTALATGPDPDRLILRLAAYAPPANASLNAQGNVPGQANRNAPAGATRNAPVGAARNAPPDHLSGFQYFFGDKLKGRETEGFDKLVIRARSGEKEPVRVKVTLTNKDAMSFSAFIEAGPEFRDIELPLNEPFSDSVMLLPRPYPGFLPLWFKGADESAGVRGSAGAEGRGGSAGAEGREGGAGSTGPAAFRLTDMEKIQVTLEEGSVEIESIWMQKNK